MPSKSFLNLNSEKRKAILDAALEQFVEESFKDMRVGGFVKQAHISRASFYIYFEDKRDLYRTVLKHLCEEMEAVYLRSLRKENGCFYEASCRVMQEFDMQERWKDYVVICREVLEDLTCRHLAMEAGMEFYDTERRYQFFTQCYGEMNKDRYPDLGKEYLIYAMDLAIGLLFKLVVVKALNSPDRAEEGTVVKRQLMIVERALQNISSPVGYKVGS